MSKPINILVVEDEPVVIESAKKILLSEGYRVDTTMDAESAFAQLDEAKYDVLVTDLMLPGMSGLDLLELACKRTPHIPVIMISGYATLDNAVQSFKQGAFDFLPKPFDTDELLAVVSRASRYHRLETSANGKSKRTSAHHSLGQDGLYFLGKHAWTRREANGNYTVGVGETFANTVGDLQEVRLPAIDADLKQGSQCACLITTDGMEHRVWAPLSGRVLKTNANLNNNTDLVIRSPFGDGWLAQIMPSLYESEIDNLTRGQSR